jgi:peptide/nickel transport system ATP-binding protein
MTPTAPTIQPAPPSVATAGEPAPMLRLEGIRKHFQRKPDILRRAFIRAGMAKPPQVVRAVDSIDLSIRKGEVVGLVGESGCGKSTLGRIVAGILPQSGGRVAFNGRDMATMSRREYRAAQLDIQMVFQNPFASLNPRIKIADAIAEAPAYHGLIKGDRNAFVDEQLLRVGIDPSYKNRFAHQFSGGQRQRIAIARALSVDPAFIVCDEAVAALDVSIQAQVLNLFMDLKERLDLTYLFISHDLGVIEHISDRAAIMYLGRIVEEAPTDDVFRTPNHPYTQALLEEVPRIDTSRRKFHAIRGELPSPLAPPPGCHFHPRCPHAFDRCRAEAPRLREIAPGRRSACHLNDRG